MNTTVVACMVLQMTLLELSLTVSALATCYILLHNNLQKSSSYVSINKHTNMLVVMLI